MRVPRVHSLVHTFRPMIVKEFPLLSARSKRVGTLWCRFSRPMIGADFRLLSTRSKNVCTPWCRFLIEVNNWCVTIKYCGNEMMQLHRKLIKWQFDLKRNMKSHLMWIKRCTWRLSRHKISRNSHFMRIKGASSSFNASVANWLSLHCYRQLPVEPAWWQTLNLVTRAGP